MDCSLGKGEGMVYAQTVAKTTMTLPSVVRHPPVPYVPFSFSADAAGCATFKLMPWEPPIYQPSQRLALMMHIIALSALFPMRPIAPVIHAPKYYTHATHARTHPLTRKTTST